MWEARLNNNLMKAARRASRNLSAARGNACWSDASLFNLMVKSYFCQDPKKTNHEKDRDLFRQGTRTDRTL
jgi:hypothetical protein